MRNDGREVAIPAAVLDEYDATGSMGLIRVRADGHLQQLDVTPCAVRTDAGAQL